MVLAVSGRGEFDGKGRMKKLTHLSSVRDIDRPFSPDARLAELSELSEAELFSTRLELARLSIERAVLETGRAPALFLDEDDHLEARWTIRRTDDTPSLVVNVTFGPAIEVYVFDRAEREVVRELTIEADAITPGDQIANIIKQAVGDGD